MNESLYEVYTSNVYTRDNLEHINMAELRYYKRCAQYVYTMVSRTNEYEVSAPPPVVVIPGTYVYSIVDPRFEIFFYHGAWWRHHNGYWFTARDYNRSWVYVRPERVPMAVVKVPHDYRNRIRSSERIEYRDLSGNWERWEREKHWDRHEEHHNYSDRDDYGDRRDDRGRDHRW